MSAGGTVDQGKDVVRNRRCGTCTLCCKVLQVPAIGKPAGALCKHCKIDRGCEIYADRPNDCRQFHCGFLTMPSLKEVWRPSHSKLVLVSSPDGNRVVVHVDPDRPAAWKRQPFYAKIKEWGRNATEVGGQVLVCIGKRTFVIFPDHDLDIGFVEEDEIVISAVSGSTCEVFKIRQDDPRAASLIPGFPKAAVPLS